MKTEDLPKHLRVLVENAREVERLVAIHGRVVGTGPGRKHNVEVLHKSAIVLLVACWETYVEALAREAVDNLIASAPSPRAIPGKVKAAAARGLRAAKDETRVWALAGDGWKEVLRRHKDTLIEGRLSGFHNPDAKKVNQLFEELIGIRAVLERVTWAGMPRGRPARKLGALVALRGEIAHRVKAGRRVYKEDVTDATHFFMRLAGELSNWVGGHLNDITKAAPWAGVKY